jgi:signal transduction histidine kinase
VARERTVVERAEIPRKPLQRARAGVRESRTDGRTAASRALDGALARIVGEWTASPRRLGAPDDAQAIARLADQLCRVASGGPALVNAPVEASRAIGFVEAVRRQLLEDARNGETELRSADLATLLMGLDAATHQLALRPPQHPVAPAPRATAGADLVVEVAHDIRSPLTSILFLVETLRNGHSGPINAIQERQLALVYSAAFGLSAVACDIVDLARGSDRLIDKSPEPFSVREVFQSVNDILMPMVEEKGLVMKILPPAVDFLIGYPAPLNRILLNLATNAVKFTRQGFVELAATQLSATRVEFSVRDTGPGIPREVLGHLFEPIRGNARGTQSFSSAGLGLAICARLVSGMNSELSVVTSETGTRFAFALDLPPAPRL